MYLTSEILVSLLETTQINPGWDSKFKQYHYFSGGFKQHKLTGKSEARFSVFGGGEVRRNNALAQESGK